MTDEVQPQPQPQPPYMAWPSVSVGGKGKYAAEFLNSISSPRPDAVIAGPLMYVEVTDQTALQTAWDAFDIAPFEAAAAAKELDQKVSQLWSAANNFQSDQISGAAIGVLTVGVIRSLPKSIAIKDWINAVWTEYYRRKAALIAGQEVSLDFSSFGSMPFSVPDLLSEVAL